MGKNDFSRGVQAAINAQQGFNEKQARATEELGRRIVKKIDDLGNIVDVVLSDLNAQEKERLYSLTEQFDPKNLDGNEKELLVSLIYTLSMQHGQNSPQQMDYYYNLKKYLEVANPSGNCDLSCVENIENVSESKGIHYVVCEFLFLKHGDHSYREEFSDFLDNFYVKPKDIKQVEEQINARYDILGAEDIVRHFDIGYDPLAELSDDEEAPDGAEENINLEHIRGKNLRLNDSEFEPYALERSYNTQTEIADKIICLDAMININTSLTVRECVIKYEIDNGAKLILGGGASLTFVDCCFECTKRVKDSNDYIISSDGVAEKLEFVGCRFESCQNFINDILVTNLKISECYIIYPLNFVSQEHDYDTGNCEFNNNIVILNNKNDTDCFQFNRAILKNSIFVGVFDANDYFHPLMSAHSGYDLQNCTFYNLNRCEGMAENIQNCEFISCSNPISSGAKEISNCVFSKCTGTVIESSPVNIKECRFLSCTSPIFVGYTDDVVSNCDFINIKAGESSFLYTGSLIQTRSNQYHQEMHGTIEYCNFDDIELGNSYIAECMAEKKLNRPALFLKDCKFSNIHTSRADKEIVRRYCTVKTLLSSSAVETVSVGNCTGINKVDNGKCFDIAPTYSKKKGNGELIGAIFSNDFLERLADEFAFESDVSSNTEETFVPVTEEEKQAEVTRLIFDFLIKDSSWGQLADSFSNPDNVFDAFSVDIDDRIVEDFIGVFNPSISGSKILGIMFMKDRLYFKQKSDSSVCCLKYADIEFSVNNFASLDIVTKTHGVITFKGVSYATEEVARFFSHIVWALNK